MRRFVVAEKSMSPSLNPGDRVLARRARHPVRDRICFIPHPSRSGFWLVKRIVGIGGDTVELGPQQVRVNGKPARQPWAHGSNLTEEIWDVPPDHVFVLSDARSLTRADSRSFGPVRWMDGYLALVRYRKGGR